MVKCQLQCGSSKVFQVEIGAISKSVIVKAMLDDLGMGQDPSIAVEKEVIPLPNISEPCMEKVIEWCELHKDDPPPPPPAPGEEDLMIFNDEISDPDKEFLKMEDSVLFDLILAANYLDIKGLLDLTTTHVAHMIVEARTPEGIRKRFNIKNDLTPEDLKKIEEEALTWLDSDSDEEDEEETKAGEASGGAEGGAAAPTPGTSQSAMEMSPGAALEGAVGGHD